MTELQAAELILIGHSIAKTLGVIATILGVHVICTLFS